MNPIIDEVLSMLKSIRVHELKCKKEQDLEDNIVDKLKKQFKDQNIRIKTQDQTQKARILRPDIIIGNNSILIEIKMFGNNLNDIYRLYYQTVKYSKIAIDKLILFVFDPEFIFKQEDREELESMPKTTIVYKK